MSIGATFRLLREEHEISQREMAKRIGVERNSLDRFEKTSRGLSLDKINTYKKELHIDKDVKEKDIHLVKDLLENIFDCLFYTNRKYNALFSELQKIQSILVLTEYYPLLYIFDYCVTVQNNTLNYKIRDVKVKTKLDELSDMISLVENTIPHQWLSLYYDYVGERNRYEYKYHEATAYYDKSEKLSKDDRHIAMIYYRRAITYTQINQNVKALEYLDKASPVFQKYMNYEKCVNTEFLKAMIYDNLRDYDHAITIYERCLKVVEQGNYSLSKEQIYNNMIWALLMKGDYEKVTHLTKEAGRLEINKKAVYLYEVIAYYALNIEYKANSSFINCTNCKEMFVEEGLSNIYELMKNLLVNDDANIENTIAKLEYEKGVSGVDVLHLSYTIAVEYYKRKSNTEKVLNLLAKAHQL